MNRRFSPNRLLPSFSPIKRFKTAETKINISKKLPKDFFGPRKERSMKRSANSLPSLKNPRAQCSMGKPINNM